MCPRTDISVSWLKESRHGKIVEQDGEDLAADLQKPSSPPQVERNPEPERWERAWRSSRMTSPCRISSPFWNTSRDWKLLPLLTGSICCNGVVYGSTKPAFTWLPSPGAKPLNYIKSVNSCFTGQASVSEKFRRLSRGPLPRKSLSISFNLLKSVIQVTVHLAGRDTSLSNPCHLLQFHRLPHVPSDFIVISSSPV